MSTSSSLFSGLTPGADQAARSTSPRPIPIVTPELRVLESDIEDAITVARKETSLKRRLARGRYRPYSRRRRSRGGAYTPRATIL